MRYFVHGSCGCWDEVEERFVVRDVSREVAEADPDRARRAAIAAFETRTGLIPLVGLNRLDVTECEMQPHETTLAGIAVTRDAQRD